MNTSLKIDTSQFSAAVRQYSLESKRELSDELNKRMFYILLRFFVLLEPHSIRAAREKAKAYLNAIKPRLLAVGERARKSSKLLQRVDLIAQARRIEAGKKALTAQQIEAGEGKKGVSTLRRRAAAQGYVKSMVARALSSLSKANLGRSFSQFGRAAVIRKRTGAVSKPEQTPNAALVKIAGEYGMTIPTGSQSNAGVFGGTKARVTTAKPGLNPMVLADMEGFAKDSETGKINSDLAAKMQRAINDETAQLVAKMTERAQSVADRFSA